MPLQWICHMESAADWRICGFYLTSGLVGIRHTLTGCVLKHARASSAVSREYTWMLARWRVISDCSSSVVNLMKRAQRGDMSAQCEQDGCQSSCRLPLDLHLFWRCLISNVSHLTGTVLITIMPPDFSVVSQNDANVDTFKRAWFVIAAVLLLLGFYRAAWNADAV